LDAPSATVIAGPEAAATTRGLSWGNDREA
jgi:hypothetical protein